MQHEDILPHRAAPFPRSRGQSQRPRRSSRRDSQIAGIAETPPAANRVPGGSSSDLKLSAPSPTGDRYRYASTMSSKRDVFIDDRSLGLEAATDALGRLAAATAQDGTGLLVAVLPELHQINGAYPFEKELRKIEEYLVSCRIRTIDLLACLRGHGPESGLWITPADAHPNVKANSLIAR